jgi:lipopolysaccharide assembly protein A
MGRLSRFAVLLIVALGGIWGVLFCLANGAGVALDLVLVQLPEAPLAIWIVGAFILGGVCGLLASSLALWRGRLAMRALKRRTG